MRVEGTASRGGSGPSLQRAKVGYCPCCSTISHIAVPPSYVAGLFDKDKCTSTSLWQSSGPWASRYLAAHQYYNISGSLSLSSHWDWAASTLDLTAPHPLSLSDLHEPPTASAPPKASLHATSLTKPTEVKPIVTLESTIPPPASNHSSAMRDLSKFLVDDDSPSRSRCSDGRNLLGNRPHNLPRGGHRLEPDQSMSEKGKYGKYYKGKGKDDLAWVGKSTPVGDYASCAGKPAKSSYGKSK